MGTGVYNKAMTAVYVLADENLPDIDELERALRKVAGDRYTVECIPYMDALQARLSEVRQAVVFFSAPTRKLTSVIHQCREVLPGTACVAIVDEAQIPELPVFETDCHFMRRPYDDFSLMSRLSSAVRQAELLTNLSNSAQTDEVTNLFNRRYFIHRLGEEISLSKRHLSPLCAVIIGVNFYQMYVDSYGYDFVNAMFRLISDKITASIRHEDIVARVSDDEIGILLPRSTEKGARVFADRLVRHLNATIFKFGGYEEELSVCAGLAGFPLPDEAPADADTLIRYGRHALHQARCRDEEENCIQLFSEIRPML